jgi:hypothetical protein
MPDPITAVVAGVGSVASSAIGSKAAGKAGAAQERAALMGVEEQRAAREEMRGLLQPYVAAGGPALQAQMAALGLAGPEAQQAYVTQQEQNPLFQALARQQEEAMLQSASATGGLRGGNIQGALAQFRPALLNQFLEQQYGRLGGLTALGQQSAAGVGTAGMQSASNIGQLFGQVGQAQAGAALGKAAALQQTLNLPAQFAGLAYGSGRGGFGSF